MGLDTLDQLAPENGACRDTAAPEALSSSLSTPGRRAHGVQRSQHRGRHSFYTLDQLGAAYGFDSLLAQGLNGQGETIGVYEVAPHSASDVSTYETCFGLTNPCLDGGGRRWVDSASPGGTEEADADIEQAATQAPGAAIISYEGPNTDPGPIRPLEQDRQRATAPR